MENRTFTLILSSFNLCLLLNIILVRIYIVLGILYQLCWFCNSIHANYTITNTGCQAQVIFIQPTEQSCKNILF